MNQRTAPDAPSSRPATSSNRTNLTLLTKMDPPAAQIVRPASLRPAQRAESLKSQLKRSLLVPRRGVAVGAVVRFDVV